MDAPQTLDHLGERVFSLYPPIRNIEHNEWRFRRAEWSEMLVVNTKTGLEVWIPRRFVGEVSSVDEPVMLVGLTKELEYKGGSVWPYGRRLIQMPQGRTEHPAAAPAAAAESARAASKQPATESRISRLIVGALLVGIVLCIIVISIYRVGPMRPVRFTSADQEFLGLNRHDDYFSVVRKLGQPAESHWKSETGELQYRALWYPQRSYFVILMGPDRQSARYIGAVDRNWRVIHYIELPNGSDTSSMLRGLQKF